MSSNQQQIREFYDAESEDERFSRSRAEEQEFYYTQRLAEPYLTPDKSVLEVGCATGRYALAFADRVKEYHGIDLHPGHIAFFRRRIRERGLSHVHAAVGDATRLDGVGDGRYDVVMAFGPLYHLPEAEREAAFAECARVCRPGGILLFSYINKAGAYMQACMTEAWRAPYPNRSANELVLRRGMDDLRPGLFFYTMPEEMEERARAHGLEVIRNSGVDFTFRREVLEGMTEEAFAAWRELTDFLCAHPSCTGLSNHALLICRKPDGGR
ncbi:MAG TPA: methyltransferase domain-containing protein [Firmicutes bacterium]|nr:methyltransferase domain-containing protein [Bacillota bacterium]